jgi:predicted phosphoribosyltransferase
MAAGQATADDENAMFRDRHHAGSELAESLTSLEEDAPVILAIPRGGVPVACEVARALGATMDVITVRKLGAPQNPEFAIGAVAEDGSAVLDTDVAQRLRLTHRQIDAVVQREVRELDRRIERYRDGWAPMDVNGGTVVIVDDGLATGLSDLAAVRALRKRGAARVIVAAPVASDHADAGASCTRARPGRRDRSWIARLARRPHGPGGRARPRDLRAWERQQPAELAQPCGRIHAQPHRPRDAAVRPPNRTGGGSA